MEEKLEVTIQSLQSEKNARAELERTLKKVSEEKEQLLQLKFSSVKASGVGVGDAESSENLKLVEREAAEFKVRSEQEIYRLESIVRELQDRLGKNLGEYTVEDIRSRDEEIAQLHEANTAAQEWMAKAVEHHQRLSTQAATLENENTSLKARLLQAESKITADKFSEDEMEILKNEVSEKTQKLVSLGQDLSGVQVELNELRKEKEDHQGLLDELGIAMDDVGVMKQKLIESESLVKDLEAKLKNDSLSKENEELREDVESMEKEILDLRSWVEMAQQKMEELMAANLENEKSLSQAVGEVNKLQNELSELRALGSSGSSDQSPQVEHRVLIERLEAKISNLQAEKDELSKEKERVTSDWNILESKQNELEATCSRQKELLEEANGEIERLNFHLDAERQLSNAHATEIDTLKAEKSALEQAAAQEKESSSFLPLEAQQGSLEVAIEELKSRIEELEDELNQKGEELRAANEALSKGSDVVQQWEGEFWKVFIPVVVRFLALRRIDSSFFFRPCCRTGSSLIEHATRGGRSRSGGSASNRSVASELQRSRRSMY
jgi:chromosome segregation ATPase